jgi:hypothetical protein
MFAARRSILSDAELPTPSNAVILSEAQRSEESRESSQGKCCLFHASTVWILRCAQNDTSFFMSKFAAWRSILNDAELPTLPNAVILSEA